MFTILQRIVVVLGFFSLLILKITLCSVHFAASVICSWFSFMGYSSPQLHFQVLRLKSIPKLSMHYLPVNTIPSYKTISYPLVTKKEAGYSASYHFDMMWDTDFSAAPPSSEISLKKSCVILTFSELNYPCLDWFIIFVVLCTKIFLDSQKQTK